jgi:hypothetical protein
VSNVSWDNAWVIGENTHTKLIPKSEAVKYQETFEKQLILRNWIESNN